MKSYILIGVSGALITGVIIGTQVSLTNRIGSIIGSFRTGMYTNMFGGATAMIVLIIASLITKSGFEPLPRQPLAMLAISGAIGLFVVTGISYSLQYTGVLAGISAIILGQLLVSTAVDAVGWGGLGKIPFSWQRILGILLMLVAVYLLLPRK